MARPRKQIGLDQTIANLLASIAPQIARALRDHVAMLVRGGEPGSGSSAATRTARRGRPTGAKPGLLRNTPKHCVHPGCTNAHKGPRFSFLCDKHRGISKTDKKKYNEAWKAAHKKKAGRAAKPMAAT